MNPHFSFQGVQTFFITRTCFIVVLTLGSSKGVHPLTKSWIRPSTYHNKKHDNCESVDLWFPAPRVSSVKYGMVTIGQRSLQLKGTQIHRVERAVSRTTSKPILPPGLRVRTDCIKRFSASRPGSHGALCCCAAVSVSACFTLQTSCFTSMYEPDGSCVATCNAAH